MRIRLLITTLVLSLTIILSGCDEKKKKLVVITYTPLANTRKILSNGQTATAEEGMFRIYRVVKVTNTDPGAENFKYESSKVHLDTEKGGKLMWVHRDGGETYSEQSLEQTFVAGTMTDNLPIYLVYYSETGEVEPNDSWTPLKYKSSDSETVLIVPDPPQPSPIYMDTMTSNDLPYK